MRGKIADPGEVGLAAEGRPVGRRGDDDGGAHRRGRREKAGRGHRTGAAPDGAVTGVLGRLQVAPAQRGQRDALGGGARPGCARVEERLEEHQDGEHRRGDLRGPHHDGHGARDRGDGDRRLGPRGAQRLEQRRLPLLPLGGAQELRAPAHQPACAGEGHHPAEREPHPQRADGVAARAAGGAPQRPERPSETGGEEHERHHEHRPGQLPHRQTVVQPDRHRGEQQEHGEGGGEQLAEPLQRAEQIVDALRGGEPHPVLREWHQLAPVLAEDLDAAERPAEALPLQPVEAQRHQPRALRLGDVDAAEAEAEQAQARLGVLGDAVLVPAADLAPAPSGGSGPSSRRR